MSFSNKFYSKSMDLYGINAIENQSVTLPPHLTDYFNAKMPGETSIEKSENKPMDVAPPTATSVSMILYVEIAQCGNCRIFL